jgi:hypothetical protein
MLLFLIWVFDLSFFFLFFVFCSVEKKRSFRGSMRKMGSSSAVDILAMQVNKITFKIMGFA